ncbi:MAG: hypothetical protein R3E61_05560 [Pseudomonadales bacterium]
MNILDRCEQVAGRTLRYWGALYGALVVLFVVATIYTIAVSMWRGPWRDMWEVMPFLQKAWHGQAGWADYWEHYGSSHRPLLSRWLWLKDMQWVAGSNALLLAVSVLMQSVIFLSIYEVLRRDSHLSSVQRTIILFGVLFCLCNVTQIFNFLHTFDVQWFLVTGFVVLALERLLAGVQGQHLANGVIACLALMIAGLNNFSALIAWPVALLLMVVLRYSRIHIAIFFVAAVIYLIFYFYGLPSNSGDILLEMKNLSFMQLMSVVQFFSVFSLWYLGNPLSFQLAPEGPLHLPRVMGWIAPSLVAVLLCSVARAWWQGLFLRKHFSALAWMGLALALFGFGVAVVTAIGRGLFWDNVYALRYQNIVLLFWIGIVLWLASSVRWRYLGLLLGAFLLLMVFATRADWYHEMMLKTGNRTRDAHLALVVGLERELSAIQPTVSRSHLGPNSQYTLAQEAAFLRSVRVGPYADPNWQVPPFSELSSTEVCAVLPARVDVRGENYARLSVDFAQPTGFALIAWFDRDHAVLGLLLPVNADTFAERLQQSVQGTASYAGFARSLPQQKPAQLFARERGRWCRLQVQPS